MRLMHKDFLQINKEQNKHPNRKSERASLRVKNSIEKKRQNTFKYRKRCPY